MNELLGKWGNGPLTTGIIIGVPLVVIALAIAILIRKYLLKVRLRLALDSPEALQKFRKKYPPGALLFRSGQMEKLARIWGSPVIIETGLAPLWAVGLTEKPTIKNMCRVLRHCPEDSVFAAFTASLEVPKLQPLFATWMEEKGEEQALRILSKACRGEIFDGSKGREILGNQIDTIRELTGHPEWHTRFFAYQIILKDDDPRSTQMLWDAFRDPYPEIRKKMTADFTSPDREGLYGQLWGLIIGDPSREVRFSAKERIQKNFSDLYKPEYRGIGKGAGLRLLELLNPDSSEDRDIAITYLQSDDLEVRYPAACFLEKCGILKRLLLGATLEDKEEWERNFTLLTRAVNVNVSSFLNALSPEASPGALYIGAKLLKGGGNRSALTRLGAAVFQFFRDKTLTPQLKEIYVMTLEGLRMRGEDAALKHFLEELNRRRKDEPFLAELLPRIPERGDSLFLPLVKEFFKDPDFLLPAELGAYMKTLPPDMLLPIIFDILNAPRGIYPHRVRIFALKILGELKYPYFLQKLLEGLSILPPEEAREFAPILRAYPKKLFDERVGELLRSSDSRLRASLLAILPALENQHFMKEIWASLEDSDPDVRIAAIRALQEFGEMKPLSREVALLRDPVERVRLAAARVLGEHGTAATLEALEKTLKDPHEVTPVKRAVVDGLGHSRTFRSIVILGETLADRGNLHQEVLSALRRKTDKRSFTRIIALFQEASSDMRDELVKVFTRMEEETEERILNLLETDEGSLIPHIARILEGSGYVEKTIRQLSDRDVKKRRTAVLRLALLKTRTAFRGLVLAARDPDQRVSVPAMEALEGLDTPEKQEMLESLKQDPDRRIRKYIRWAMERLETSDQLWADR